MTAIRVLNEVFAILNLLFVEETKDLLGARIGGRFKRFLELSSLSGLRIYVFERA